jgi:NadR type nicotinamide-nucleotide adenylyltransferase
MEKKDSIIRIALIGPESTAKSTLAAQLAAHYGTVWVEEYAREYLAAMKTRYRSGDIEKIAKEQLRREKELLKDAKDLLFADTELILAKVWHDDLFGTAPGWFSEAIAENKYDLYLLTYPDLPWEEDPLRENPHRRELLFKWYKKELEMIGARYAVITGKGQARLENSITAVDFLLKAKKDPAWWDSGDLGQFVASFLFDIP